jgi:hypothetical protein
MLRASCSYCHRRSGVDAILPRGWKVHGDTVLCVHCRRRRYRLRSLTMKVLEPVGAPWPELRGALEESVTRCSEGWEARIANGGPVVRLLLGSHWCELRLKYDGWRTEQRRVYEKIASGEVTAELSLYREPIDNVQRDCSHCDPSSCPEITCRMVAWLPRGERGSERVPDVTPHLSSEQGRSFCRLEDADIGDLRDALRENRISFPSQVPTFSKHDRPDLQRKLAQLYFVLGWNCSAIGTRYGLLPGRVRQVLTTWKRRAVETGYIQHIPQATSAILGKLPYHTSRSTLPDLVRVTSAASLPSASNVSWPF